MTLLDWLFQSGFTLKRVATTNGGEYAGGCPWCGGRDRFRVWPEQDGGRYWCRGCGKTGDSIQYLRDTRGLSFQEACLEIGREPSFKRTREHREDRPKPLPSFKWQERAGAFLNETVESLWKSKEALSFLHGRGLRDDTIRAARLGWNPRDRYEERTSWGLEPEKDERGKVKKLWLPAGLVIPLVLNSVVMRLRIRRPEGEPRYVIVSGSDMRPIIFDRGQWAVTVVESELDGLLIDQEAGDMAGAVALGSVQAKPDRELNKLLKQAALILVSLDFDEAGARASWGFWAETYGAKVKRWPVPIGKDPSEAFQNGLNVRAWIEVGLTPGNLTEGSQGSPEAIINPFPKKWLQLFDDMQLERLAIMTVDGGLTDAEALEVLHREQK